MKLLITAVHRPAADRHSTILNCHQNGSSFFSMFLPPRQMTAWCSPLGEFVGAWISLAWVPLVIVYTYRLECVPQTLWSEEFISSGPHLEYKETATPHQMPPWGISHCSIFPFLLFLASLSGSHIRDQTLLLEYYTRKGAGLHPPSIAGTHNTGMKPIPSCRL